MTRHAYHITGRMSEGYAELECLRCGDINWMRPGILTRAMKQLYEPHYKCDPNDPPPQPMADTLQRL